MVTPLLPLGPGSYQSELSVSGVGSSPGSPSYKLRRHKQRRCHACCRKRRQKADTNILPRTCWTPPRAQVRDGHEAAQFTVERLPSFGRLGQAFASYAVLRAAV